MNLGYLILRSWEKKEEPAKEIVKEKLVRLEKNQENEVLLEESVSRKEWSVLPRFR